MKKFPLIFSLIANSVICSIAYGETSSNLSLFKKQIPKECQDKTDNFEQNLACAQKYFLIGGEPINPMIIKDLIPWISDYGNQVLVISLLKSQKSNKYFCENLEVSPENYTISNFDKEGAFSYSLEGKTDNGIFVIHTVESGGGTGRFSNLLFVRIREHVGLGEIENEKLELTDKMIVIEKLGSIYLGDRVNVKITIDGNSVLLKTQQDIFPHEENTKKFTVHLAGQK